MKTIITTDEGLIGYGLKSNIYVTPSQKKSIEINMSNILRFSQIISAELALDRLLNNIIEIVIKNFNAEKGALLTTGQNGLLIQAEYTTENRIQILQNLSTDEWKNGASSIIKRVQETLDPVLIENASSTAEYQHDQYIMQEQIKSVICLPIVKEQQLKAILYFENNVYEGAFTPQHLELLLLLSIQMAISIENSFSVRELQQNAEKQRLRAEKAEEFIDIVCHEIRNPMMGMYGHLDSLREAICFLKSLMTRFLISAQPILEENIQQIEKSIKIIDKCTNYQKKIVDDVLSLSKIDSGKMALKNKPFKPKQLIEEIIQLYSSYIKKKNLNLISTFPNDNYVVQGDEGCLRIVITNFITNAIKYTQHGHIDVSLQTTLNDKNEVDVVIKIKDTGIGLTEEEKSLLFQRFSYTASTEYGGHGIGLMISQRFITLMGGSINVESEKGKGTEMIICLNYENGQSLEPQVELDPANIEEDNSKNIYLLPALENKTVLVVDDDSINRKILIRLLHKIGYECVAAANGAEAVKRFQEGFFDCIFMDIVMPIMNGLEATREIRNIEEQRNKGFIPIIGLSGSTSAESIEKALKIGMTDYLTKPCRKENVYGKLDQWVTHGKWKHTYPLTNFFTPLPESPIFSEVPVFNQYDNAVALKEYLQPAKNDK